MFPASTGMHLRRTDVKDGTGVVGGGSPHRVPAAAGAWAAAAREEIDCWYSLNF